MERKSYVYILGNRTGRVLYAGVTSSLTKRIYEHKNKIIEGFTRKYNVTKLLYYEIFDCIEDAITREKQIKSGSRKKKIELIKLSNPSFKDLYYEIL
jgi:putative endonuclease